MPSYGVGVTLQYLAWNTSTNAYVTGDVANHTLRWIKDGTAAATTNSPSEVDSTNAPGVYKVVLTTTETQCQVGTLAGKSSTSNVVLIGMTVTFENLPTASPGASTGLPTVDASNAVKVQSGTGANQINLSSGNVTVGTNNDKTGYSLTATTGLGNQTANITGSLSGSVGSVTGAVGSVTGNVGGNVVGSVASVTGAVGSVTGNVGGNVVGSVGSVVSSVTVGSNIKKNQALSGFTFTMVLSSDHYTPATGKTVTATRSLDGGAFGSCTNAVSEIGNGWYKIDLAAGDLNGNTVSLNFSATSCDATTLEIVTVP